MATVRLDGVDKVYPNGHVAARDLDLTVRDGELLVLVGPSGCGKSTALRMVAGLETPTSGRVFIGDQDVTDRPPQERDIAMVFQSYALYPHMSVRENLAFGLRMRGTAEGDRDRRVERAARSLGLEPMLDRKPSQLSGGQRQRVALGRATVREPAVFLFDEPLSNLDAKLRVQTRAELARLHRRIAATMIYVTHDQEEAMTLGQRVAVMNDGALEQVAPPMEVYSRPATLFVAGFVGSPAMNFFPCELRDADAAASVGGPLFDLRLEAGAAGGDAAGAHGRAGAAREAAAGDRSRVVLGVRPSDISVGEPAEGDVRARVDVVEPLGSQVLVHLEPEATEGGRGLGADADDRSEVSSEGGETEIRALVEPERTPDVDRTVGLRFRRDRLHLFDAASGRRVANGP